MHRHNTFGMSASTKIDLYIGDMLRPSGHDTSRNAARGQGLNDLKLCAIFRQAADIGLQPS